MPLLAAGQAVGRDGTESLLFTSFCPHRRFPGAEGMDRLSNVKKSGAGRSESKLRDEGLVFTLRGVSSLLLLSCASVAEHDALVMVSPPKAVSWDMDSSSFVFFTFEELPGLFWYGKDSSGFEFQGFSLFTSTFFSSRKGILEGPFSARAWSLLRGYLRSSSFEGSSGGFMPLSSCLALPRLEGEMGCVLGSSQVTGRMSLHGCWWSLASKKENGIVHKLITVSLLSRERLRLNLGLRERPVSALCLCGWNSSIIFSCTSLKVGEWSGLVTHWWSSHGSTSSKLCTLSVQVSSSSWSPASWVLLTAFPSFSSWIPAPLGTLEENVSLSSAVIISGFPLWVWTLIRPSFSFCSWKVLSFSLPNSGHAPLEHENPSLGATSLNSDWLWSFQFRGGVRHSLLLSTTGWWFFGVAVPVGRVPSLGRAEAQLCCASTSDWQLWRLSCRSVPVAQNKGTWVVICGVLLADFCSDSVGLCPLSEEEVSVCTEEEDSEIRPLLGSKSSSSGSIIFSSCCISGHSGSRRVFVGSSWVWKT